MRTLFLLFLFPLALQALVFSNPAQPELQKQGIMNSPRDWYCLRLGYVSDFVYQQEYEDEFPNDESEGSGSKLKTDAAIVTLNIKNYMDFNVMVGASQLQIDRLIFTKRQFAWACGTKILFYQTNFFSLAFDFKYFETKQKPTYFVYKSHPFNVFSKFRLDYFEAQAALGIALKAANFFPYFYGTYLYSKAQPVPSSVILYRGQHYERNPKSLVSKRWWGMALGATVLAGSQGSLTVETRLFNQNATTVTGEFRF